MKYLLFSLFPLFLIFYLVITFSIRDEKSIINNNVIAEEGSQQTVQGTSFSCGQN